MIDTVFISDLHLHPDDCAIQSRFDAFILWAKQSVKNVYILGDFFHAWPGDDALDSWSHSIAKQLCSLTESGVNLFYLAGNRDFLLGHEFAKRANWKVLSEPSFITLGNTSYMLVHGDRYCTKDRAHQRFRRITRNPLFQRLFLYLPLKYRNQLVDTVRHISQNNDSKSLEQMDVVDDALLKHCKKHQVKALIHGHTHKPGLVEHILDHTRVKRYVLSDWDDNPHILCYYDTKGLCFERINL